MGFKCLWLHTPYDFNGIYVYCYHLLTKFLFCYVDGYGSQQIFEAMSIAFIKLIEKINSGAIWRLATSNKSRK